MTASFGVGVVCEAIDTGKEVFTRMIVPDSFTPKFEEVVDISVTKCAAATQKLVDRYWGKYEFRVALYRLADFNDIFFLKQDLCKRFVEVGGWKEYISRIEQQLKLEIINE